MSGVFITFEGPEGSGKSTHARRLVDRLRTEGREVVAVHEPGGTRLGEAVRELVQFGLGDEPIGKEAETLLFCASRAQLVRRVIVPALAEEKIVVCDRFIDSTTAYQGYARGIDVASLMSLYDFVVETVMPDLTILLDVEAQTGLDRIRARMQECEREDRIESEEVTFHERVRQGYLELAELNPGRIKVIDSNQDENTVHERVWEAANHLLAQRGL